MLVILLLSAGQCVSIDIVQHHSLCIHLVHLVVDPTANTCTIVA